ncbi:MAG TPA: ABC transporter substrate-binding protein [Acidimicrobiales bacterium]|nr:ABC transporter substrate-binding protein [Acidimicrobiales bacterium]
MERWGTPKLFAGLTALALAAAACSGNHTGSSTAAQKGSTQQVQAGGGASTTTTGATGSTAPTGSGAVSGAGASVGTPGAAPGAAASATGGAAPTSPAAGPPVAGTQQTTAGGFHYTAANLFPASQDRVGITANQITLCMHAPLIFGPAFQDSATDFQVYWQYLNSQGGIFGRKVNMVFTDDQYTPSGGVQAAQQCQQSNPFLMTAGVGFDTVPAVRQWAEQNHVLYLSSFATENGLYNLRYTFQLQPSVEQFGAVAGRYVAARYPGKVGVIWRNSPNWQGGRDSFEAAVRAKGSKVVADVPVQENQGDYTQAILAMQSAGAQTVLAWVNVLEFDQLEKQAAAQGYHPRWVTATFNLVTQTLGHDIDGSNGPAAVGLWVTPEYHNGDTTSPWSGEEKVMQQAYARYDAKHTITDTDWQAWLAFKQLARMLSDCGQDCTRNKLAGMLLAGYKVDLAPLCTEDFSRGRGRLGSFAFDVSEATNRSGTVGWKQVATCAESFQ